MDFSRPAAVVRCAFCSQSDLLTLEVPTSETTAWRAVVRNLRSWPPNLPPVFRSPLDAFASVLFPAPCRVCGNSLVRLSRSPVCDDCWHSLTPHSGAVCLRCSEELQISAFTPVGGTERSPEEMFCQRCRLAPPPFERAVAYGGYSGVLRALIHALKYEGVLPIAERLGALLAWRLLQMEAELPKTLSLDGAVLVPVPLHSSKRKQRGFNHAELLAKATMGSLRRRRPALRLTLESGLLERRKATQSQAGLSPHQRRVNLRGVFFAPKPEEMAGRRVLLVDDIYTTGATARACSQVLRRTGAASVMVATVARPQREIFAAPQFEPAELPMEQNVAFWEVGEDLSPRAWSAVHQQPATTGRGNVFGQSDDPRA